MRITNKIMQNNQMYNINNNKVIEDQIATQVATGKKINRPSDDPVIAIRALRLRSTVSELNQYYQKNAQDANSWLSVTEGALSTVDDVLTDMRKLVVAGPDKYKTMSDWDTIVTQLDALSNEYYSTGNVDYAGRYVFTGYRTNTPLTYTEATTEEYSDIQDEFNASAIDTSDRVTNTWDLADGDEKAGSGSGTKQVTSSIDLSKKPPIVVGGNVDVKDNGDGSYTITNKDPNNAGTVTISAPDSSGKVTIGATGVYASSGISGTIPFDGKLDLSHTVSTTNADALKESDIEVLTVGRLRLSYDNINVDKEGSVELKFREPMAVPATAAVQPETKNIDTVDLSFTDADGISHTIHVPTNTGKGSGSDSPECTFTYIDKNGVQQTETYTATKSTGTPATYKVTGTFGTFEINEKGVITNPASFPSGNINKATASVTSTTVTEIKYTASGTSQTTAYIPLSDECKQPYTIKLDGGHTVQVNTDGTYTLTDSTEKNIIQVTQNGSIHTSYVETTKEPMHILKNTSTQAEIDAYYKHLTETGEEAYVLNADTGEILMSSSLTEKLKALEDIVNAKTIDVVYDKSQFKSGDTKPEHLFTCTKVQEQLIYNSGSAGHIMTYDVGYNQEIEVNTTAPEIFTTDIRRNIEDLKKILAKMKDVDQAITTLKGEMDRAGNESDRNSIQYELDAAQKAYDALTEIMKDEFSSKITSVTTAADAAGNAVTTNGTRSRRLELIMSRLADQRSTFRELQEDNEGIELAEAATNLATAELAYQASLQATGKIISTSLMDYI